MMTQPTITVPVVTLDADPSRRLGYVVHDFNHRRGEIRVRGIVTDFWVPLSAVQSITHKTISSHERNQR
jgi:hypothetical protein